jgi:hypothetical protein
MTCTALEGFIVRFAASRVDFYIAANATTSSISIVSSIMADAFFIIFQGLFCYYVCYEAEPRFLIIIREIFSPSFLHGTVS